MRTKKQMIKLVKEEIVREEYELNTFLEFIDTLKPHDGKKLNRRFVDYYVEFGSIRTKYKEFEYLLSSDSNNNIVDINAITHTHNPCYNKGSRDRIRKLKEILENMDMFYSTCKKLDKAFTLLREVRNTPIFEAFNNPLHYSLVGEYSNRSLRDIVLG